MARFEFATATRVLFGPGTIRDLPAAARSLGRHALVVTGRTPDRFGTVVSALADEGLSTTIWSVIGEPAVGDVEAGAGLARQSGCDLVVAIGGGSVLDAGKAVAALAPNDGPILDYLEVIGRGRPLRSAPLSCVAVPTTAGTGSEVTRNSVLRSVEHRVKVSLRSPRMLPAAAIVDPELTISLPPDLTASTGLDALTQLIEPYVSCRANALTDALAVEGIRRAARALPVAVGQGDRIDARADMALASLFSGMALANAGLGAVHGFAAPIGGRVEAPHGAVCAALLPHVMAANVQALEARDPDHPSRTRFDEIARLLTDRPSATSADGIAWVRDQVRALGVPPLSRYGLSVADVDPLVQQASRASSMKANPVLLTDEELAGILAAAL